MAIYAIAFLLGDLLLQQVPVLVRFENLLAVALLLIFLCHRMKNKFPLLFMLVVLAGFCWAQWVAYSRLAKQIPASMEAKHLIVTGIIASLPVQNEKTTQFLFTTRDIKLNKIRYPGEYTIRLSWHDCPYYLEVGSSYELHIKIKRIHGISSPGAFNIEKWALLNNIDGSGYVIAKQNNLFIAPGGQNDLNYYRQKLLTKLKVTVPPSAVSHWIIALIMGERQSVPAQDWEVLRKTGTNHLMAIAGLHIGMIALIVHLSTSFLWRRSKILAIHLPAHLAGAMVALMFAIFYSALAGFSLPTQRACIMFAVYALTLLMKRKISAWDSLGFALCIVLLANPYQVFSDSFWLSFGTIAIIIFGMSARLGINSLWWKWGKMQWIVGIGLLPFSLWLFGEVSIVSCVANTLAIPWMTFIILPLCFLACLCLYVIPDVAMALLWSAEINLLYLWKFLTLIANWKFATWHQTIIYPSILILTLLAVFIYSLPRGFSHQMLAFGLCLPLLFQRVEKPAFHQLWVTVFDVGQGLAVLLRTKNHTALFDTGAKFSLTSDMGKTVLIPYLRRNNIFNLDKLIISHGDNDHSGGAGSVIQELQIKNIITSVPSKMSATFNVPAILCVANHKWQWDGIDFEFIYPNEKNLGLGNDSSCVLKVSNGDYKLLLTGDIEKNAEAFLVEYAQLKTDILVAPHHGSKTSSTKEFVNKAQPTIVIYSTGYLNRYHFPHPNVIAGYANAKQFNTAETGTIEIKLDENKLNNISLHRLDEKKYWIASSARSKP